MTHSVSLCSLLAATELSVCHRKTLISPHTNQFIPMWKRGSYRENRIATSIFPACLYRRFQSELNSWTQAVIRYWDYLILRFRVSCLWFTASSCLSVPRCSASSILPWAHHLIPVGFTRLRLTQLMYRCCQATSSSQMMLRFSLSVYIKTDVKSFPVILGRKFMWFHASHFEEGRSGLLLPDLQYEYMIFQILL